MPRYEIPNRLICEYAGQIATAAEFLYEHIAEVQCALSVLHEGSLAVELYLKSLSAETVLHRLEGCEVLQQVTAIPRRGNVLDRLFDAIDQPIRDELQAGFAISPSIAGITSLRAALGRYNETFVDIRYIFERQDAGNLDVGGLIQLVRFLRAQVPRLPMRYTSA
ncbi:MAG TPA: hypothetical protein VKX16_18845 [Chloroflexota bacterium]|nr:hypothetical protein [Chloroflexota bacterium]